MALAVRPNGPGKRGHFFHLLTRPRLATQPLARRRGGVYDFIAQRRAMPGTACSDQWFARGFWHQVVGSRSLDGVYLRHRPVLRFHCVFDFDQIPTPPESAIGLRRICDGNRRG